MPCLFFCNLCARAVSHQHERQLGIQIAIKDARATSEIEETGYSFYFEN